MKTILHVVQIHAAPGRVYEALTTAKGLAGWWTTKVAVEPGQRYAQQLSDDVYGTYTFNWGYYLNSLKLLCEKGAGTPFQPPA